MTIIEKISKLLKEQKIQQKELTNYLGVTQSAFSEWKKGKTDSYYKFIPEIAKFLNVSTDFLFFGEETHTNLTEDEKRLLAAYRDQSEEGKKMVRKLLDLEEPANQKKVLDLKSELQIDVSKAFTKTTT